MDGGLDQHLGWDVEGRVRAILMAEHEGELPVGQAFIVPTDNATHPQPIRSILCSGLGTGNGKMPPERCARQMRRACDVCVHGMVLRKGGIAGAVREHMGLIDCVMDD
ncbi:MAG: hypothetical protein ACI8RZ_000358 [Myxococcota bacterium]|jgi:hypothetical protein